MPTLLSQRSLSINHCRASPGGSERSLSIRYQCPVSAVECAVDQVCFIGDGVVEPGYPRRHDLGSEVNWLRGSVIPQQQLLPVYRDTDQRNLDHRLREGVDAVQAEYVRGPATVDRFASARAATETLERVLQHAGGSGSTVVHRVDALASDACAPRCHWMMTYCSR